MDTLVIDEVQFVEITDLFNALLNRVGVSTGRSSQDVKTLVNSDIQEVARAVMGRLDEARRHFHKTLGPPGLFLRLGHVSFGSLDFAESVKRYSQAIELDPNLTDAYLSRGIAYGQLGQLQQAIDDFDHAIELDPSDALSYNHRGCAYSSQSQYQLAIDDYDDAIRLD